jgi:hypothetical protein
METVFDHGITEEGKKRLWGYDGTRRNTVV